MDHNQTEEEIQEEMEALGISNDETGKPDIFLSGPVVKVIVFLMVAVLVVGFVALLF